MNRSLITTFLLSVITIGANNLVVAQDAPGSEPENPEQAKPDGPLSAKLSFLNGDVISGNIVKWDDKVIQISNKFFIEPATFPIENLLNVMLDSEGIPVIQPNDPDAKEKAITTIKINNRYNMAEQNDLLKGEFKQIDKDTVTIDTAYAGELIINRNMINKMWIETSSGYVYSGPKNLNEWHNNEPSQTWKLEKNSLIADSTASISKEINLPTKSVFSLDHEWKGNAHFSAKIYSSDHKMTRPDFYYEFVCRNAGFYVQKVFENRSSRLPVKQLLGEPPLQLRRDLSNASSAHYDLYSDIEEGVFHIYVNGIYYLTYEDPDPNPEKFGSAIHLYNFNNAKTKISKIKINKWNGVKPQDQDDTSLESLTGKGQKVLLRNGDAVLGQIGAINRGYVEMVTEFGTLKVPVIGMKTIDLSGTEKHEPLRYKEDVKAWFNDQEWVILKPIEINGNKLKAFHQAFGEKEFDLRAFQRIDLHINDEKLNNLRQADDW